MKIQSNINNQYKTNTSMNFARGQGRKSIDALEKGIDRKMRDVYASAACGFSRMDEIPYILGYFNRAEELSDLCKVYNSTPRAKKRSSFPLNQSKSKIN